MTRPTRGMSRILRLVLLVCLGACVDGSAPELSPAPLIISNPVPIGSSSGGRASAAALVGTATDFVYVSMSPGTIEGDRATVRNVHNGSVVAVEVIIGGFDPVPLPAETGDSVELTVTNVQGSTVYVGVTTVTARRPPVVVRTEPPPRKRDVPLNAKMMVVFSEPMAPGSIDAGTMQLQHHGQPVPGTTTLSDPLRAEFVSDAPLLPDEDYVLVIGQGVTDQSGDPLATAVTVPFHTGATAGIVAFVGVQNGQTDLYVMVTDGSAPQQLTNDPAVEWTPAWSPDGARIAYVNGTGVTAALYVMNADGSGQMRVADSAATYGGVTWSPDGAKLVFDRLHWGLTAVNADGSDITPLASEGAMVMGFAWSPDGTRLAVTAWNSPTYGVEIVQLDGSGRSMLTDDGHGPAWSPDGSRILFSRYRKTPTEWYSDIYMMNADGTNTTVMTPNGSDPQWSPDGTTLTFVRPTNSTSEIYVMNADGSAERRVTYTNAYADFAPGWSPDGRQLAWVMGYGLSRVVVASADGVVYPDYSGTISVVPGSSPAWRP